MFDFYKMFFGMGYLKAEDLKEACKWGCINKTEYKEITGEEYVM